MSDNGRQEKPQPKQQKPTQQPSETTTGVAPRRAGGLSGILAERREVAEKALYRFSDGQQGTPPLPSFQSERTAPIRDAAARIMRKASSGPGAGAAKIPESGGAPLPGDLRGKLEPKLGADLSGVRIHTSGDSAAAASHYGARAFTLGNDVHFNKGEFAPGTKEGDRLLGHELTHVVQGQNTGPIHRKADEGAEGEAADHEVSQPGEPAEQEADAMGDHVADSLHGEAKGDTKGENKADKGGKKAGGKEKSKRGAAGKSDEAKGQPKESGEAEGGDVGVTQKAPPKIAAKLAGVGRKPLMLKASRRIYRALIPASSPAEYGVLRNYTNAIGKLRAGIDEELKVYEQDRVKTGSRAGQPRDKPEAFPLTQAQDKITAAKAEIEKIEKEQLNTDPQQKDRAQTLTLEKVKLLDDLSRMREAAQKAAGEKNMPKFKELFHGMSPGKFGIKMSCDALPHAQANMGKPWRQAVAAMAAFAQGNQAGPSKGSAQAHSFMFADQSRIRIDVPIVGTGKNERVFGDNDRPHMAIFPPNDNEAHLSVDGIVVPAASATAHIPLAP